MKLMSVQLLRTVLRRYTRQRRQRSADVGDLTTTIHACEVSCRAGFYRDA